MTMRIAVLATLTASSLAWGADEVHQQRIAQVAETPGLVAFWDFDRMEDGTWTSYYDDEVADRGYPVFLRRIGDPSRYTPADWPYEDDDSRLRFDSSGPFGRAVRFNQGFIFAEIPRGTFDGSPLDVHGRQPFTLIAWTRFVGRRHMVAGIWDEGGWDKYGGRRQIALFGGLFGSRGVIGHVSSTGAASYPQSTAPGAQYARCRAIDGASFDNHQWVSMAISFDPATREVVVYLNGVATPTRITDPVAQDVFRYDEPVASNPFSFPWPIYSPRTFQLKYNGYDVATTGVYEHWLAVDLDAATVTYDRSTAGDAHPDRDYRVEVAFERQGAGLLATPLSFAAEPGKVVALAEELEAAAGDELVTSLHLREESAWRRVGEEIRYTLREGAPFTFGRALGLGDEPLDYGTQLDLDGVALFNRGLREEELRGLSFHEP